MTILEAPPTPVPAVADGMIVTVVYLGQQKLNYHWNDPAGRNVTPQWWDGASWSDTPVVCQDPYSDSRGQPRCIYDSIPYRLEVGRECHMPIEAARYWFGDERATTDMSTGLNRKGIRAWVNDRPTEVRRLRCLYDNRLGDENTIIGHPVVEVFTIDGERVPMVLDDPMGINSTQATQTVADQDHLMILIQKQQAQLDQLRRQLDANKAGGTKARAPKAEPRDEDEDPDLATVAISELPEDPNG
ncbi:MAG TPA: hypothetical protein VNV87_04455 [Acidimicrobiales bacterium]|jgi:hypothetical protein|nr:hypothetical protein [Acidimicrobiales bacterium]